MFKKLALWFCVFSLLFLFANSVFAVNVTGNVTYDGVPVCSMVLANGQYMFTCSGDVGSFDLDVPLDPNGEITVFTFCSGLAPYKQVITPDQGTGMQIHLLAGEAGEGMEVNLSTIRATGPTRAQIEGSITYNGVPLNAMALANGLYQFTPPDDGNFSLNVKLGEMGEITLFGFCEGLPPHEIVYTTGQIDFSADYDGDGYSVAAGDCNDLDNTVYPGAISCAIATQFTEEMLSGKTFYDIWTEGDGFGASPLKLNVDGSRDYVPEVVTDFSSITYLTGGSWSVDDSGILAISRPGSSESYYKLLSATNPNAYQVCWRPTYEEVTACTQSKDFLFFDIPTAQRYYDEMSPVFTMEWLNGKTLYSTYFGNGSDAQGNLIEDVPSVTKFEFDNGTVTVTNIMNSDILYYEGTNQLTTSYQVADDGWLFNYKPLCVGPFYLKTQYVDGDDTSDGADMWFFDENEAINYANSLTEDIPLECCEGQCAASFVAYDIDRGTFGPFFRSLNTTDYGYIILEDPTTTAPVDIVEAFEVRPGDCDDGDGSWSDCDNDRERSELSEADKDNLPGDMHWYGWSIYVPEDYPNIYPTKTALGQFHQQDSHPVWMFQHSDSGYYLDDQVFGTTREYHKLIDESDLRGQWHNIELQVLWATDGSGYFRVWVDGVQKVDYSGQTMDAQRVYFKYGVYRSFMSRYKEEFNVTEVPAQKVYYANVKRSDSRDGLQP